jgi:hypothetical protein
MPALALLLVLLPPLAVAEPWNSSNNSPSRKWPFISATIVLWKMICWLSFVELVSLSALLKLPPGVANSSYHMEHLRFITTGGLSDRIILYWVVGSRRYVVPHAWCFCGGSDNRAVTRLRKRIGLYYPITSNCLRCGAQQKVLYMLSTTSSSM